MSAYSFGGKSFSIRWKDAVPIFTLNGSRSSLITTNKRKSQREKHTLIAGMWCDFEVSLLDPAFRIIQYTSGEEIGYK
jgi:hypothetical protein